MLVVDSQVRPVRTWELTFTTHAQNTTRLLLILLLLLLLLIRLLKCVSSFNTGKTTTKADSLFTKGNCLVVDNKKIAFSCQQPISQTVCFLVV